VRVSQERNVLRGTPAAFAAALTLPPCSESSASARAGDARSGAARSDGGSGSAMWQPRISGPGAAIAAR